MWFILLVLLAWAIVATVSASNSSNQVLLLNQELARLKKLLPQDSQQEEESIEARFRAFQEENQPLCDQAFERAEKRLQESGARFADKDTVDSIRLTREEIRRAYQAFQRAAECVELDLKKRILASAAIFTNKEHLTDVMSRDYEMLVRSCQWYEIAYKLRDDADLRWKQESANSQA